MRHLYLIAPILAIFLLLGIYGLIKSNSRPIPKYYPIENSKQTWTSNEYYNHLKVKPFDESQLHQLLIQRTLQKPGVYLENLLPAMDSAAIEVVYAYHTILGDDYTPVITSGNDYPFHKRFSKHYYNAAIDFRIIDVPIKKRKELVNLCSQKLGPRFKVIWERGEMEHLHVELSVIEENF